MKCKQIVTTTLIITLLTIAATSMFAAQGQTTPILSTDKEDYFPEETVSAL